MNRGKPALPAGLKVALYQKGLRLQAAILDDTTYVFESSPVPEGIKTTNGVTPRRWLAGLKVALYQKGLRLQPC